MASDSASTITDCDQTERYYRSLNDSLKQKTAALIRQAESALQNQLEVCEVADLAEVDSALEDEDSTLAGSVQEQGDTLVDLPDVEDGDHAMVESAAQQMNDRSQVRFYRASFRSASSELQRLTASLSSAREENCKLRRRVQQLEGEVAGSRVAGERSGAETERLRRAEQRLASELQQSRAEVSALQRRVATSERELQVASARADRGETQLRRGCEERARLKEALADLESRRAGEVAELREQLRNQEESSRQLDKQRQELMVGFKKQLRLIDVLKRQRVHLQAAKLLQISEQQFLKVMDLSLKD